MGRQHFFDHALQTYAFSELTTHESQADTEKSHVTKIKGCLEQTVHSDEEREREREEKKRKKIETFNYKYLQSVPKRTHSFPFHPMLFQQ